MPTLPMLKKAGLILLITALAQAGFNNLPKAPNPTPMPATLQAPSIAPTQQALNPEAQRAIDQLFSAFDTLTSPGYAVGISQNGKTLYTKGYGAANLDYQLPITPQSAFSLASVSKQFTGACIALLVLENKLDLEAPASQYIPQLRKYKHAITIKHLLYNSSGLEDYYRLPRKSGLPWSTFYYFDVDEAIEATLGQKKLKFKPGTQWDYCNTNFMLLTKIVQKVSGQPFASFAQERLFKPLGMHNTLVNDDVTLVVPNRVTPYNFRTQEAVQAYNEEGIGVKPGNSLIRHPRTSPHYGGSGVISTVEDLLKWCANMHSKAWGGQPFYDLMHKTPAFAHGRNNQAMGLYWGNFEGRKMVAWDGGAAGISTQMMRLPDQGIAIVVLCNVGTGRAFQKVNEIGTILIEHGYL